MAKVNIHGAEHAIHKIFSNDFVFTIPQYQRPYAWTTEQAGELLSDLLGFMGDGNDAVEDLDPYFLGSIVLIKEEDAPDAEVVDGQQRLTTLTTLLAGLRSMVSVDFASGLTRMIYEKSDPLLGTSNRFRLTLRERDAEFFQIHIQKEGNINALADLDPTKLSDSQQNLRGNMLLFAQELSKLPQARCARLAQFIVTRCYLVVVSTPDLDSAYRIFSVLNDRGMDLSHADILKADIIGKIPQAQQDQYTNKWEEAEVALGRETFKELFAHVRTIHLKTKAKETVLKELRENVNPGEHPQRFIDETLLPFAEALGVIRKAAYQSTKGAEAVNERLRWLNRIDNSDWLPPAILYLSHNSNDAGILARFFADLERLAASLMILSANVNKRIERYSKVVAAIEGATDMFGPTSPLQLTTLEQLDVSAFLDGNIYLRGGIRLYVLLRLDAALSGGEASYALPTITVEHVLPQHPSPSSLWAEWFPEQDQRDHRVHCLGNLVLLSRRKYSQAQNYDFALKKQKYFATDMSISPFALTTQVLKEQEWTPDVIDKRQDVLLGTLKKLWRLQ